MKKNTLMLLKIIIVLVFTSLACGINLNLPDDAIEIIPTITQEILIPHIEGNQITDVKINFGAIGAGKLNIGIGAAGELISGTATYNVEGLQHQITTSSSGVTLDQGTFEYELTGLPNFHEVENSWDLLFDTSPINLDIRGTFTGNLLLGGFSIQDLRILTGISNITLNFNSPNLIPMSTLHFTSGGTTNTQLIGLANANFSLMEFEGGAGNYTLDYSGNLQRDATIEIKAGLSNINLIVPIGTPAIVSINGELKNINRHGAWLGENNVYSLVGGDGPTLTFIIDLGAGNLTLDN